MTCLSLAMQPPNASSNAAKHPPVIRRICLRVFMICSSSTPAIWAAAFRLIPVAWRDNCCFKCSDARLANAWAIAMVGHLLEMLPAHVVMHVGQLQVIRRKLSKPLLL